ncbi:MAG TPA: HEAT repeat domain-containing protein [bacterium]|nr:HEAT repeat domain-containing protein [bacterium]HNS48884.1 HEAT repeat domain-containing protein [bacterium]
MAEKDQKQFLKIAGLTLLIVIFIALGFARGCRRGRAPSESLHLEKLKDDKVMVRIEAAFALSRQGTPAALPALEKTLKEDSDPGVRRAAAWAIASIRPENLKPYLTGTDAFLKLVALEKLGELDFRAGRRDFQADLIPRIRDGNLEVARTAVTLVARSGGPKALTALEDAARGSSLDGSVRLLAIRKLGETGDDSVLTTLNEISLKEGGELRQAAQEAVKSIAERKRGGT